MLNFINIDENTKQTQWNTKLPKLTNCGSVSEEKLYQHLKGNVSVRIRSTRNRLECALWAQLTNIYKQKTVGFIFTLTTNKHKHKTLWSKCPYVGTHLKGEDRAQSNKSFISKKKKRVRVSTIDEWTLAFCHQIRHRHRQICKHHISNVNDFKSTCEKLNIAQTYFCLYSTIWNKTWRSWLTTTKFLWV